MANLPKILKDWLYFSVYYDKFVVDVVTSDGIHRGYVTDVMDQGLLIDFHHTEQSVQCVDFADIRVLPIKKHAGERYCRWTHRENVEVEVLIRTAINQPLTWTSARFLVFVPQYGDKCRNPNEEVCALARVPSAIAAQLVAVKMDYYPDYACQIRIRQQRHWTSATKDTFFKLTLRHAACSKKKCPFPVTPLSYWLNQLDVGLKLCWLRYTGTLLLASNADGITVLCRQHVRSAPRKFHRLVFHTFTLFLNTCFRSDMTRYRRVLFAQSDIAETSWFMKTWRRMDFFPRWLQSQKTLGLQQYDKDDAIFNEYPDDVLFQIMANLDLVTQRTLRRTCSRWDVVLSSPSLCCHAVAGAPLVYIQDNNQALYLANTLFRYTAPTTRAVLLDQFSHSHSGTILPVLCLLDRSPDYYLSYRRSSICLWYELEYYPPVSNMQIYCTMIMNDGTRKTLEILLGTKEECRKLVFSSTNWTYCCSNRTMAEMTEGIPLLLDVYNQMCYLRTKVASGDYDTELLQAESLETEQSVEQAIKVWPISEAASSVLTKAFDTFLYTKHDRSFRVLQGSPPTKQAYRSWTMFSPESLKVLIRNPCTAQLDSGQAGFVESWLRLC
ncbi:uncharacterized protein LOC129597537 isoform X2 [Paramacrobiotus metropolitanus]|uniref:uncharacterized protein LOC129597537 isoform X2 n=1 Tax=Paramacrobiotus metropolitanus TaxID=2943436 RepID=UPI0024456020|nr:uncharacterized protein LOC129597537 isoform X2 [Paramacrobiotus metropolitanus]